MADIVVIGGHGKVALLLEPMLVAAGDEVTAVIRSVEQIEDIAATGAEPLVLDVERADQPTIDALVADCDAVIWSAGAGGGSPERTRAVDHDAAVRVLNAAEAAGVRFIMVSYFGASTQHGVPPENPFFHYAQAKGEADAAVRASGGRWVILGPSALTAQPEGGVQLSTPDSAEAARQVSRATLARVIAELVRRPEIDRVTINVQDGELDPAEALEAWSGA